MTSRLPRWAVLLLLPLVAGSLLLMHGLDAGASDVVGHGADEPSHSHEDGTHSGRTHEGTDSCPGCLVHVVMTCVAVIVAVVAWQLGRHRFAPSVVAQRVARWRERPHIGQLRARDPVWVRLSVMTC